MRKALYKSAHTNNKNIMFRVGFGQDSHRLSSESGSKLFLGGYEFPLHVESNCDGDVMIHALCNAIEQALGNGSLSVYSDSMCESGIKDSREYLKVAVGHAKEKGYRINNAGISFEGKMPKIEPILMEIKKKLCPILEIEEGALGINATSGEGLTAFGRGEGVQAFAIVSLVKIIS